MIWISQIIDDHNKRIIENNINDIMDRFQIEEVPFKLINDLIKGEIDES